MRPYGTRRHGRRNMARIAWCSAGSIIDPVPPGPRAITSGQGITHVLPEATTGGRPTGLEGGVIERIEPKATRAWDYADATYA
jgi:hypothetical protein